MSKVFSKARIILPRDGVDMSKWSVVACDQYTSEPDYWNGVAEYVGDAPSMLNMVLPEIYLESDDVADRIRNICATMDKYLEEGILCESEECYIYTERTLANGKVRRGIIGKIDLEEYDYSKGSVSAVRATEGTILERIPPRMRVRENASVESPHIMILIDDAQCSIIEPLAEKTGSFEKAYDFDVMMESGHLRGFYLPEKESMQIDDKLAELCRIDNFNARYGTNEKHPLAYAMGDGNHSLATAKACWEELKKQGADKDTHPARYALAEIVNLHDESLDFEPIHRVIFDVDIKDFINYMMENGVVECGCERDGQVFELIVNGESSFYKAEKPTANITVGSVQNIIDKYLKEKSGAVDYIHGEDVVRQHASKPGNIGILFDVMDKSEFFRTVISDGALPRKTFSMGHAYDKRFYTECRKIR